MVNYGKRFEIRFKEDWEKSFPDGVIERLPDQMTMYKGSENICDFICYDYPNQFYLECKTHAGASIPFEAIPQYERMLKKELLQVLFYSYMRNSRYYISL